VALAEASEKREEEYMRLRSLRDETVSLLQEEIPSIIFYGTFDSTSPEGYVWRVHDREMKRLPNNINCRVPGISSEEMILRLDAKGFAVSHKSACASMETDGSYVLVALGATDIEARENIRISMGRNTMKHDMVRLVGAMKEISNKYTI
jgi:cysteine desulfurase